MRSDDTLLRASDTTVRLFALGNYLLGAVMVAMLVLSVAAQGAIEARLLAKYGSAIEIVPVMTLLRLALIGGMGAVWAVARLFAALRAMIASVRADDAFAPVNAARLRTIGWMLLVLQCCDLLGGLFAWRLSRLGIDYVDWTPSFTGWLAVLVAFILARVFAAGAAMRAELEGTI